MKLEYNLLVMVGLSAIPWAQAASIDLSKLPRPAQKQGVTYAQDVRPILERSCFGCHGERRQRGDLRLDSLPAALQGGENGKVIVPGKSQESLLVIAVARIDEDTAMPPRRRQGGGGFGGGGGGSQYGRTQLSQQMIAQADQENDGKVSEKEWAALAAAWFDVLDPEKTDKVNQEQFTERLPLALAGTKAGERRGNLPAVAGYVTTGFFKAADLNQDAAVTRSEFVKSLGQWYENWASQGEEGLTQPKLYAGLREVMPQSSGNRSPNRNRQTQRPSGGRSREGGPPQTPQADNRPRGDAPAGGQGAPPSPLTQDEVALVRAWIDQGAK